MRHSNNGSCKLSYFSAVMLYTTLLTSKIPTNTPTSVTPLHQRHSPPSHGRPARCRHPRPLIEKTSGPTRGRLHAHVRML